MGFGDWILGNPERVHSTKDRKRQNMAEYDEMRGRAGGQGRLAGNAYLSRSLDFDPSEAVTEYGRGFMDEAGDQLTNQFEDLTGGAVGSGRMKTGFFQNDGKQMFQDFNRRVANAISAQSLNAASLDMQNTQGLGAYGQDMFKQQGDLLTGEMDRAQAEENARTSPMDAIMQGGGMLLGMGMPGGGSLGGSIMQGAMNKWGGGGGSGGGGGGSGRQSAWRQRTSAGWGGNSSVGGGWTPSGG